MECPLCGYEFDENSMQCHTSCPMNAGCSMMCCPQCGYQMVDETKTRAAGWLRRLLSGRQKANAAPIALSAESAMAPGVRRLTELKLGQSGEVVAIETRQASRLDRLSALGVVPGSAVMLLQRAPAFILRVGETELTVDEQIAQEILTRA